MKLFVIVTFIINLIFTGSVYANVMQGELFGIQIGKPLSWLEDGCIPYYGLGTEFFDSGLYAEIQRTKDDTALHLRVGMNLLGFEKPFPGGIIYFDTTLRTATVISTTLKSTFTSKESAYEFAEKYASWFEKQGAKVSKTPMPSWYNSKLSTTTGYYYIIVCGDYGAVISVSLFYENPHVIIRFFEGSPVATSEDLKNQRPLEKKAIEEAKNPIIWKYCDK